MACIHYKYSASWITRQFKIIIFFKKKFFPCAVLKQDGEGKQ